jgi:hypothetical protein
MRIVYYFDIMDLEKGFGYYGTLDLIERTRYPGCDAETSFALATAFYATNGFAPRDCCFPSNFKDTVLLMTEEILSAYAFETEQAEEIFNDYKDFYGDEIDMDCDFINEMTYDGGDYFMPDYLEDKFGWPISDPEFEERIVKKVDEILKVRMNPDKEEIFDFVENWCEKAEADEFNFPASLEFSVFLAKYYTCFLTTHTKKVL